MEETGLGQFYGSLAILLRVGDLMDMKEDWTSYNMKLLEWLCVMLKSASG